MPALTSSAVAAGDEADATQYNELRGDVADHGARHDIDGSDEIAGLANHSARHEEGGDDELDVSDLAGLAALVGVSRRQGGHATNWATGGTTNYTPPQSEIQCGTIRWTGSTGAANGNVTITFPRAFGGNPIVIATVQYNTTREVTVAGISTTEATVYWSGGVVNGQVDIMWVAIGPSA